MKRTFRLIFLVGISQLCTTCIEPIAPENIGFSDLLVVEGLITDQLVQQEISIQRTSLLNDSIVNSVSGASVHLIDQDNNRIDFVDSGDGRYLSAAPYAASVNGTLQLSFTLEDGREYESEIVTVQSSPPIDSLYVTFTPQPTQNNIFGGLFEFFLDAKQNPDENRYYRWGWNSTFELKVRTPSRWLISNGEFINRENDSLQVEVCWSDIDNNQILVEELQAPELGIDRLPLLRFHSDTRYMVRGYSIEVKQYGMTQDAYNYYNQIAELTQNQGSLSDTQPGTIVGNVRSVTNGQEIVLGYFSASQEQSVRQQYVPLDFLDAGYKAIRPNFITCFGVDSVTTFKTIEDVTSELERLGDDWVLAYFTDSPPLAYIFPKICSDCRNFGTNKRPDFWQ